MFRPLDQNRSVQEAKAVNPVRTRPWRDLSSALKSQNCAHLVNPDKGANTWASAPLAPLSW